MVERDGRTWPVQFPDHASATPVTVRGTGRVSRAPPPAPTLRPTACLKRYCADTCSSAQHPSTVTLTRKGNRRTAGELPPSRTAAPCTAPAAGVAIA
ncbi:hypothetical protein MRX96_002016 [Rhipicephalus microplus]